MKKDKYKNFNELASDCIVSRDYKIFSNDKGSDFVIVGIHAGKIEPGTEEVVVALANDDISSYVFRGTIHSQHITSHNFDETQCLQLVSKSKKVISIHGKDGEEEFIMIGGLDEKLISILKEKFLESGFKVKDASTGVTGRQRNNICNRGSSGAGVQLEMSRGLRDSLVSCPEKMKKFTSIVRDIIV